MPAGDPFSSGQSSALGRVIAEADDATGLRFSVVVGAMAHGRASALAAHDALPQSSRAVLIAVDPTARGLEIVTGPEAARQLGDHACALAAASMTASFAAGDLAGGLRAGISLLRERGVPAHVLHLDTR